MAVGEETHRGFGFVDFFSESDAKVSSCRSIVLVCNFINIGFCFQKAFEALCHSTHLYGRRLVLEWAAAEEGVEELRKRTADHFQSTDHAQKKSRKSVFDATTMEILPKGGDEDMEDE